MSPEDAPANSNTTRDGTARTGLAFNPTYTVSRRRASWTAQSDDPTYLAQLEPIVEGLRMAGVPEQ
jgi:hypothetical protein